MCVAQQSEYLHAKRRWSHVEGFAGSVDGSVVVEGARRRAGELETRREGRKVIETVGGVDREVVHDPEDRPAPRLCWYEAGHLGALYFDEILRDVEAPEDLRNVERKLLWKLSVAGWDENGEKSALADAQDMTLGPEVEEVGIPGAQPRGRRWKGIVGSETKSP